MNLASQLEGILEYSEGMKPETRDKALKETVEYYKKYQQKLLDYAEEDYHKEGSSPEKLYLKHVRLEKSLVEKVIKGETTFQREVSKLTRDQDKNTQRRKKEPGYLELEFTLTHLFSIFYDEMESKAKKLDETIKRLYGELKD